MLGLTGGRTMTADRRGSEKEGEEQQKRDEENVWEMCSDREENWSLAKQRDAADSFWYLCQGLTETPLKYLAEDFSADEKNKLSAR